MILTHKLSSTQQKIRNIPSFLLWFHFGAHLIGQNIIYVWVCGVLCCVMFVHSQLDQSTLAEVQFWNFFNILSSINRKKPRTHTGNEPICQPSLIIYTIATYTFIAHITISFGHILFFSSWFDISIWRALGCHRVCVCQNIYIYSGLLIRIWKYCHFEKCSNWIVQYVRRKLMRFEISRNIGILRNVQTNKLQKMNGEIHFENSIRKEKKKSSVFGFKEKKNERIHNH